MAAVTFTLVQASGQHLTYAWSGDAAGTLAYPTLVTDAVTGPLRTALLALAGEVNSNGKAASALLSGATFTGALTSSVTSNIQCRLLTETRDLLGTADSVAGLTGVDSGAGNNPDLVLTPGAGLTGSLFLFYKHSIVQ